MTRTTLPNVPINRGNPRSFSLILIETLLLFSPPSSHRKTNMADNEDTPEVAAIKSRIESWLDKNNNKLELDLTNNPIEFNQHSGCLFTGDGPQVSITLGFQDDSVTKTSSIDQFRSGLNFVALNHLPVPGLDGIPSQWKIFPQTPMSSFSEGVTLEQYDPNTQILKLHIQTGFFAIYGDNPTQPRMACGPAPKGTYLQVRRDIRGDIKLRAKLVFN